jgi:hypothetical protein
MQLSALDSPFDNISTLQSALKKLFGYFFADSPSDAVAAIWDVQGNRIDQARFSRNIALTSA